MPRIGGWDAEIKIDWKRQFFIRLVIQRKSHHRTLTLSAEGISDNLSHTGKVYPDVSGILRCARRVIAYPVFDA